MNRTLPTTRCVRWMDFTSGILWLALVASLVSGITRRGFLPVFAAVVGAAMFLGVVALTWLTLWAEQEETRPGQFRIRSLFFLTFFVGAFFAAVQWLAGQFADRVGQPPSAAGGGWVYLWAIVFCSFFALLSVPLVLGLLNALLHAAVVAIRHPVTRRLVRRFRRR